MLTSSPAVAYRELVCHSERAILNDAVLTKCQRVPIESQPRFGETRCKGQTLEQPKAGPEAGGTGPNPGIGRYPEELLGDVDERLSMDSITTKDQTIV